jgi:hypothetical protein
LNLVYIVTVHDHTPRIDSVWSTIEAAGDRAEHVSTELARVSIMEIDGPVYPNQPADPNA